MFARMIEHLLDAFRGNDPEIVHDVDGRVVGVRITVPVDPDVVASLDAADDEEMAAARAVGGR